MKYTQEQYEQVAEKLMQTADYERLESIVKDYLICELQDYLDYMDEAYEFLGEKLTKWKA